MSTYDFAMWIPRVFFLAITVAVTLVLINAFVVQDIRADTLEMQTFTEGILHSSLISHQDAKTKRVYPGIIDTSKFTTENLQKIQSKRTDIGMNLTLTVGEKTHVAYYSEKEDPEKEYNTFFAVIAPFPQQATAYTLRRTVLVNEEGAVKEGEIIIEAVIQK